MAITPAELKTRDLSVNMAIIEKGLKIMGNSPCDPEAARRWIHSPQKRIIERAVGLLFCGGTLPLVGLAGLGVLAADGLPLSHSFDVGFLGHDIETPDNSYPPGVNMVGKIKINKVRSLRRDTEDVESQSPASTTAFHGGIYYDGNGRVDLRVHSRIGAFIRKTGVDELPQFGTIASGRMALVGQRGYFKSELAGIRCLLDNYPEFCDMLPDNFPTNYQTIIEYIQPRPGLLSLYSATERKRLTITERVWLDIIQMTRASFTSDWAIIMASINPYLRGVGAR